ncbi:VWA domain-containing protein [Epilithonimonas vandammei]|uniref:VWA domain-containing protein n=1 Tax=Epilithonimonas vandammei TaxID=2487072 RepID=A0A3G8ZD32_9FLAO|nr:VWA domain-containing protein [Epilithonimonas vandammei]AZI55063.1 VWA domain-containing protein [Epilithonimonas vandammei]
MENQDIDKMFNDAGKSAEENPKFPAFEKVWEKVEEKLDKKENKKQIIPIWLPYGIAAGLAFTFGVLYFMNDNKVKIEPQIVENKQGKPTNPNLLETSKKVEEINKTFEENMSKNPIKSNEEKDIIAYHEVEPKKDEFDDLYEELREKYKTDDISVKKDENGKIISSVNNQSDFSITNKRFQGVELERKSNDAIYSQKKSESTKDEKYITRVDKGKTTIAKSELPPPAIPKRLETTGGLVTNEVFESTYTPPPPPPSSGKSSMVAKVSALYAAEKAREISESTNKKMLALGAGKSSLEGKVAGLKISGGEGESASSKIMMRGAASFDSLKKPLYILDGKVSSLEYIKSINPKIIESVNVLKKDAATSLYGAQAANGVVVIKTKNLPRKELRKLNREYKLENKNKEEEIILPDAGKLTAGEVNDFSKWNYWQDIAVPVLDQYKETWKFYPDRRVSVQLTNFDNNPIIGKKLKLINDNNETVWESVTDNRGNVELWISSLTTQKNMFGNYRIEDEFGNVLSQNAKEFRNGQNLIKINESCTKKRALDLVFVVDATGSMGDEINYLKSELLDVLKKVESSLKNTNVRYGSVFYRDHGDDYIARKFDFSNNAENLIDFIKEQNAKGGGDRPEAVVEAVESSVDELSWSNGNTTKIMFLLLDAPPHLSDENIERLHQKIKLASKKGITIIPIAASDTDKQTEYLMRTFALLTNGTYTFLTNDSGIGNNHIKPTASEYEVEKLNDLLLRLILQRSTVPDCKNGVVKEFINKKLEVESLDKKDYATKIYPNPTKGFFKVETKRDIEEFLMYDYTGKILLRKSNLSKGSNSFDISSYPNSVYVIRLKYGTESETFKLIKN